MLFRSQDHGWGYVDINTPLKCGGDSLPPKLCSDGLIHETSEAYGIWDKEFVQYAKEMLLIEPDTASEPQPSSTPAGKVSSLRTRL